MSATKLKPLLAVALTWLEVRPKLVHHWFYLLFTTSRYKDKRIIEFYALQLLATRGKHPQGLLHRPLLSVLLSNTIQTGDAMGSTEPKDLQKTQTGLGFLMSLPSPQPLFPTQRKSTKPGDDTR